LGNTGTITPPLSREKGPKASQLATTMPPGEANNRRSEIKKGNDVINYMSDILTSVVQ